jgi:hypothetical protein
MTDVSPETMARELLPCPFCSSPRVRVYSSDWCYAECHECFARAARFGTKKKAIEAWNRRAGYSAALAAPLTEGELDGVVKIVCTDGSYEMCPPELQELLRREIRVHCEALIQLRTATGEKK